MTDCDDDRDLQERFAALRRADEDRLPRFALVWDRARGGHRDRGRLWPLMVGATVAAALLVLLAVALRAPVGPLGARKEERPGSSITEWTAPTDFLLRTPARDVLRTVPRIGGAGITIRSGTAKSTPIAKHPSS